MELEQTCVFRNVNETIKKGRDVYGLALLIHDPPADGHGFLKQTACFCCF